MLRFLYAVLAVLGTGALAALLIFVANKFFRAKEDENSENKIASYLPGVNCGGCGYGSCKEMAKALAGKKASLSACKVCRGEARQAIEKLLSDADSKPEAEQKKPSQKAVVHCQGGYNAEYSNVYMGERNCKLASGVEGGNLICKGGCLGFGDCFSTCPVGAIELKNGCAYVSDKCIGCGNCTNVCPKKLITLENTKKAHVRCSKCAEKAVCTRECIRCGECAKVCKFGAIIATEKGAYKINNEKCIGCRMCTKVCPNSCIEMNLFEKNS